MMYLSSPRLVSAAVWVTFSSAGVHCVQWEEGSILTMTRSPRPTRLVCGRILYRSLWHYLFMECSFRNDSLQCLQAFSSGLHYSSTSSTQHCKIEMTGSLTELEIRITSSRWTYLSISWGLPFILPVHTGNHITFICMLICALTIEVSLCCCNISPTFAQN